MWKYKNNMNNTAKTLFLKTFVFFISVLLVSCGYKQNNNRDVEIDLSTQSSKSSKIHNQQEKNKLKVAISAIISPQETFHFYNDLLKYVALKTDKEIELKQRKSYKEINDLLEKQLVDLAFICSGAYVSDEIYKKVKLIAVPVSNGKPFYQAYIIVNKNSPFKSFADLSGKSFAYTDPLSNTGKLYAIKLINDLGRNPDNYFSKTILTYAHDNSIQMVSKQLIDGATIDGLIYEYFAKFQPERIENIRIIKKSDYFGIPPVVVPNGTDEKEITKIQNILFNMDKDSVGKSILNNLLIDKFIAGDIKNYQSIKEMKHLIFE